MMRSVLILKSMRGKNNARYALSLYVKACTYFYLWRMQTTQCNCLTLNSVHLKYKLLEEQAGYFLFLKRQYQYNDCIPEAYLTQRYESKRPLSEQVRLNSLKEVSKSIKMKKMFWGWRVRAYKRKIAMKLSKLYWRKKTLVKLITYFKDLTRIKKVHAKSHKIAKKYCLIQLYKKALVVLYNYSRKRIQLKRFMHNRSKDKSRTSIN